MIINNDCLMALKELPENSVDAIITDPPYGLSFMGKKWDYDVPSVEIWSECLRVLKPGGYLLAFAGTRTQHRMAVRIEDAGFEIRDMIAWVYGSGFPKSLNIGKAVDKLQGNVREVIGEKETKDFSHHKGSMMSKETTENFDTQTTTITETKGTSEWEGWGTSLKPSLESITVAQKQLDSNSDEEYTLDICQTLFARIVKGLSTLNQKENSQQSIAQCLVEKNISTLEDLYVLMDMLRLEKETNLHWNIVLLWLSILGEIYKATNMSTTSTKLNTTTELKILSLLEWENIFQNITQVDQTKPNELNANVWNANSLFNALRLKLNYTQELSVQDNATSKANNINFAPSLSPIIMSRKPLSENTVAENCLKHGVGGINIDGCRVEAKDGVPLFNKRNDLEGSSFKGGANRTGEIDNTTGRFPANLIHDGSDEVLGLFPSPHGAGNKRGSGEVKHGEHSSLFGIDGHESNGMRFGDSGSAARFFKTCQFTEEETAQRFAYIPKASKSERNKGCEGLEEKVRVRQGLAGEHKDTVSSNSHPTVKPIALMEYLVKLVSKEGHTVLDPFLGSGTTAIACKNLNRNCIGIERDAEYVKISEARISAVK